MVDNRKEKYTNVYPEPVSLKQTEKILEQMKSNYICRINNKGSGFFVKIPYKSKLLPVLITANQVITTNDIQNNENISLKLYNDKKIKTIKLDSNRLKYTNEKLDITIIEIKENEDKLNNNYLELNDDIFNYFKLDKKDRPKYLDIFYNNEAIYLLNYLKENDIHVSYGKLINVNDKEIIHNCNIKEESSCSPILVLYNQKLIGINCRSSNHYKYNKGKLLIYLIIEFSKIKDNVLMIDKEGKKIIFNYIIGELNVNEDNQNIRIINSYEQSNRENKFDEYKKENENEKEIKDNCEIRINDELILFSYFHKFNTKGKYTILYIFKKLIINTNYLFSKCYSLTYINLSNFNMSNIKDMSWMFSRCSSLKNINLSNFNTYNVTNTKFMFRGCSSLTNINWSNFKTNNVKDMSYMFSECSSLTDINLSNFNTNNVRDMNNMFSFCQSLTNINLSNFNTSNVINMSWMFSECSSLTNIILSNFNTNNVKDMNNMFNDCSSLTNINLSNFNTNNVINMSEMFSGCSSLINIDLSNFHTNNVTNMNGMFSGCSTLININLSNFNTNNVKYMSWLFWACYILNKNNIITKDKRILNEFNKKPEL